MNEPHVINGVSKPFLTWCAEYGASTLQTRALMTQGMTLEEALQVKIRKHNVLINLNSVVKPQSVWCKQYGVTTHTLRRRVDQGMTLQEAFEHPKNKHYLQQAMLEQAPPPREPSASEIIKGQVELGGVKQQGQATGQQSDKAKQEQKHGGR